jgi:hypothetical protein
MALKDKIQKLIINTATPIINAQSALVAQRIASKTNIGKITKYSTNSNTISSFVDVMMSDGTTITNCVVSGNRPVGIGSTVVNINGVLF